MPTREDLNKISAGTLPGLIGIEIMDVEGSRVLAQLPIRTELLAPNGYLHAGTVVSLADTCCGYGTIANLPPGATGFTTIELKSNFLGTATEGVILCEAELLHSGRTTQIWDARVIDEKKQKPIALFRCTQMILYPKS